MRLSVVAVALLLCVSVQFLCVESRSAEDLLMTVISSYGPRLDAGYGYHNWRPKAFFPNDMGHSEKVGRAVEILPESERHLTKFQQALYFVAAHAHDVGYDEAAVANGYTVPAALKSDYDTLQSYQIANKASVEHEEFSMCAYLRALVVLANDGSSDIPQAEKNKWLKIKNIFAGINTIISTKLFVPPAQRHARLRKFLGLPAHSNPYYPHLPAFAAFKHCEALDQLKAYHHAARPAFDAVMTDLVDRFYPLPLTTTPPVKEGAPPTYTFPPPPSDLHYMVTLAKAIEAGDFASMVSKGSICSMEGLLHEFMGPSAGGMAKNQNPAVYTPLMEEYVTEIQALHSHTPKHNAIQLEKHLDLMKSPWKMINTFWQSQEGFVNLVTGPSSENWKIMQHYPDAAKNKAALLPQLAVMIHLTAIAYKNAYGTDPVISSASAALISAHRDHFATLFPKYNAVKAALEEMRTLEKRLSNTHQLDLIMSVNDCFTLQQIPPAGVAQNLPNVWRQIYTYKPTAHPPTGFLPPIRSVSLPTNAKGLGPLSGPSASALPKKGSHE